ncbi:polymer-forming cytoskeletal protein [Phenylobacterium sp. J426]|uniref:bactofilin family protein n=1 Tax=Phenylobacterium sp. J426 TaxID=2898439 RepID=UPI0021513324|nr:polymer-forming cytoskeletal protein [Phenylobacterium sp. J426]MCR5875554.1 polymer-forming cytoskeletal protein [Phenylobacterium sp. J426]
MFSKATKGPDTAASQPRKPALASLIAPGVTVRGDIVTEGDLHLDGAVEGDVSAGRLTLGETAWIQGVVTADSVEVRGRVTGTISARQVHLCASAHVDGDIRHSELAIDAGAHFEGRSLMFPADAAAAPLLIAEAAE